MLCVYVYTMLTDEYYILYVCMGRLIRNGLHSIPAPCHFQTDNRLGIVSILTPDELEQTVDQLFASLSPTHNNHMTIT